MTARPSARRFLGSTCLRWCLCLLVASVAAIDSAAHSAGNSHLYLQIYPDSVSGRFEIALSDLNPALGLSGTELEITADNLDQRIGFLQSYFLEHVSISADRGPLSIEYKAHGLLDTEGGYVLMPFDLVGFDRVPVELIIEYSVLFDEDPDHRGFLLVEHNWATGTFANEGRVSLVFGPDSRRQVFDLTSSGRLRGFMVLVHLGAEHMVFGLDHVFFLMALLLPVALRREEGVWQPLETARPVLWNVVVIVTAFAAAHAVALLLAVLGLLRLPEALVETIIAGSTTLAALNLLLPLFRGRVWWIVFGLSLFHGLGFAGGLQALGVLDQHLGLSVLAFNLGIELGQLVIVAVVVPLLFAVRRVELYRNLVLKAAAVGLILVSGVWVIERAFGIDIPMRELLPTWAQRVLP
jgi:hypothetical protein